MKFSRSAISSPVHRSTSWLLVAALLLQSLVPEHAGALLAQAASGLERPDGSRILVICTGAGLKRLLVDVQGRTWPLSDGGLPALPDCPGAIATATPALPAMAESGISLGTTPQIRRIAWPDWQAPACDGAPGRAPDCRGPPRAL